MADAWQRHRFFEGLARALMAAGRPVLLVLDNMQWCDQETLAFLTFFLGLASGTPVLVAGTLRNDTLGEDPELADWTVRMRATGLMTEISLSPLDAADTARLAGAISGRPLPADDVNLLQATTGGFPLYVIEAVRGGVDPGGAPRRPTISRQCCATASTRRPRPPVRWPGGARWGRTPLLTCSLRRVTSTSASWWGRSMSCGAAGSCASSVTATTFPRSAPRYGVRASQPAEALAAAPARGAGSGAAAR